MIYRLAIGPKGPQVVELLPGDELGQPTNMFITRERYPTYEQADAALLALRIRMNAKLTQAELYAISAILENVAYGIAPMH